MPVLSRRLGNTLPPEARPREDLREREVTGPDPGRLAAAYGAGFALVPGPAYGRRTFVDHLAARAEALR